MPIVCISLLRPLGLDIERFAAFPHYPCSNAAMTQAVGSRANYIAAAAGNVAMATYLLCIEETKAMASLAAELLLMPDASVFAAVGEYMMPLWLYRAPRIGSSSCPLP